MDCQGDGLGRLQWGVPEISRFFGIVIRMFAEPGSPHHIPHFHAYHQDQAGIFSFDPVELIAGSFETTPAAGGSVGGAAPGRARQRLGEPPGGPQTGANFNLSNRRIMNHAVHKVQSFQIVAPFTLSVGFEDHTRQLIDFEPMLAGELYGRCATWRCSIRYESMPRLIRWYGRTAPTSTQPHCMIGRSTSKPFVRWRAAGLPSKRDSSPELDMGIDRIVCGCFPPRRPRDRRAVLTGSASPYCWY
jgi:hypothetical protein